MRYPSLSPGRTGGGGGGDDETDSSSGGGLGGSIPGVPTDDGGSDDVGTDPTDPRDAPSARGNDTGGDAGASVDVGPDPTPDPSPTSRGSADVDVPDGASDGGGIGERITSNLDELGGIYRENVTEPVGDATAATNPIAQLERRAFGTNAVGEVSEGVGEGVAQIGNVPGNTAAGIDAAQALAQASARSRDQVTIGGVPTGVSVPNPEGQRQNAQAAGNVATSAAASAASSPFETTGQIIGGAVGGAALSRGVRGASRAADGDSAGGGSGGSVPSGRSNPGTGGVDSLLDDVDIDARRGTSGPSTRSRLEGEVSRAVDDVTDRIDNSPLGDFVEDTRAQLQQQRPSSRDTGSAPDRTRPADAGGSFEDVRQDSLTQTQDALRDQATRPNPGTFDGAPRPFRSGGGDTIDPDGGVSLQRGSGIVDDVDAAAGSSSAGGSGAGTGTGIGTLSGVNDPTGIADAATAGGTALDPAQILGAGTGSTGGDSVSAPNDPTGIAPGVVDELGGGRLGGGTRPGDATGTGSDTDTTTDTFAPTDTGTGSPTDTGSPSDTATTIDDVLATTTTTGTPTTTDTTTTEDTLPGTPRLGETVTQPDRVSRLGPRGGDDGGRPVRPRGEEEADGTDDDTPLLGFASDSAEFGSGIASASDFLEGAGGRGPFSL